MNNTHAYIVLKDGRHLGFAEYGLSDGFPILYFHGFPGSRLEAEKLHDAACRAKVRLIALDRPGMGLSSPKKNRTLLDFADDVSEFAATLHLDTFSILGYSGGVPFVAACAYRLSKVIQKAVIVSGMAPLTYPDTRSSLSSSQKFMLWMSRYCPTMFSWMLQLSMKALQNPKRLKNMLKQLPEVDAKAFDSSHRVIAIKAIQEAFCQNASFVAHDFKLFSKDWGFDLKDIQCPFIIWQGGEDKQAPVAHAEMYKKQVPQADYRFWKEEGHLSLLQNYDEEIIRSAL